MARPKTSASEIRAELARLQNQLKEAQRSEEETAGKMARKSGLLDLGLADKVLLEAFKEIVQRFRKAEPAGASKGAGEPA